MSHRRYAPTNFASLLYPGPPVYKHVNPHAKLICLLKNTAKQLRAMNASHAHAQSWIEPCSKATINRAKRLEKAAKDLE